MPANHRPLVALVVAAALAAPLARGEGEKASLTNREKALHVLNRLAFGPRPSDVDKVLRLGIASYIEEQLGPRSVPDCELDSRLGTLSTLRMSSAELFDAFERPLREARQKRREEQRRLGMNGATVANASDEADKIREMIPPEKRPRRVIEELTAARILRAAHSERQLDEVLVDFWMNHFNVYAAKGLDRIFVTSFERDVIRPRLWGKFEDLLLATAKSPAMLFYLDNARSVAEEANRPARPLFPAARGDSRMGDTPPSAAAPPGANAPRGLNENYARELMELHTLGVDGGYTQKDVTELARVLTGWSIDPQSGAFVFRARLHDVAGKTVLGRSFAAGGGIEEGEAALRLLARHPATARRIAYELCQRFVADDPPAALVDRVSKRFLATGGDIEQTLRAIVQSPEFFDSRFYRAKVKSPFEYVVSAVRAAGGETDGRMPIARAIGQMGEPLYLCQPPTGYSDVASAWVNAGSLVSRLNFALALTANRVPGTRVDLTRLAPPEDCANSAQSIDALSTALTGASLSASSVATIRERVKEESSARDAAGADSSLPLLAGLILGSPEFQRQ